MGAVPELVALNPVLEVRDVPDGALIPSSGPAAAG